MIIESIKHKALRRYVETGVPKGLIGDIARLEKILAFIISAQNFAELSAPPNFGLHQLNGDRAGTWSMIVTRNWRLTFELSADGALINLDLEDYHGN